MQARPHLSRARRLLVRGAVAAALAVGSLAVGVAPAHAAAQLICNGGGGVAIDQQLDGTYKWALSGVATCNNPQGDPVRQAMITGLATSPNLGVCSGDALVDAFSMNVAITFTQFSPLTGVTTTIQHQVWSLPETTFPIITPFAITAQDGGGSLGAGEFSTHVGGKCPPAGAPSMQVAWVQGG